MGDLDQDNGAHSFGLVVQYSVVIVVQSLSLRELLYCLE